MTYDVVIPCYNAATYLRDAIESALAQTKRPTEVIVVDDGSTDGSSDIASSFGSPVTVIRQVNGGECAARNRGLDQSRSEWVAFLDADDVWQPTKLERQFDALKAGVACVHTGLYLFGAQTRSQQPLVGPAGDRRYTPESLLIEPVIHPSTAMVRRDIPERFPVGVRQGGDMLFFASLALSPEIQFAYVPEPLVGYRLHPNQVTRESDAWVTHFRNRFQWIADVESRLGAERSRAARAQLRRQIVEWIDLARWNRQWERYHGLKAFARSLDWPDAPPAVLSEWLLPKLCYSVKDWLDIRLGKTA